jgi:hypothetical protein
LVVARSIESALAGLLANGGYIRMGPVADAKGSIMLNPMPELPDEILISQVQFSTRILNVLTAAGLRTVGEVRESSDKMLLGLPDLGDTSVAHLRETLGLPSCDGVRPASGPKAKGT